MMTHHRGAVTYLPVFALLIGLDVATGFYTQPEVPQFIVHPRSHLLPSNASSVNLTCSLLLQNTTANVPHPQIQWLLNGTAIDEALSEGWSISTVNDSVLLNSSLHLTALSAHYSRYYQCLAKDGLKRGVFCDSAMPIPCVGSDVLSGRGWIKLIADEEPELRYIPIPGSTILECGSEFVDPIRRLTEVDWRVDGGLATNSSNVFQLETGDLVISDSVARGTRLECFVTMDTRRVLYKAYNVVAADPTEVNETSQEVSIIAMRTILSQGDSTHLACFSSPGNSSFSSSTNITWFRYSNTTHNLPEGALLLLDNHVLVLNKVDHKSGGRYCCEVGGAEACTDIEIIEDFNWPNPAQQFINFRNNRSNCVNMSCPIPRSLSPIIWFWNGKNLETATEMDLTQCDDDPYQLYGVYQCTAGMDGEYNHLLGQDMGVVSRVMPYGITNPVGNISLTELPQPSPQQPEIQYPLEIRWSPPTYLGNLSSVTYRLVQLNGISSKSTAETQIIYLQNFNTLFIRISAYEIQLGDVSTTILAPNNPEPVCIGGLTFFPPKILAVSCTSGLVQVNYTFDRNRNSFRSNSILFEQQKNFYFKGNCTIRQYTYEIQYEQGDTNPYVVGEGRSFEPGTRCTLAAANSPVRLSLQQHMKYDPCFDERQLLYSDNYSCIVHATVGFTSTSTYGFLSSGHFEVCVESSGIGFTINITSNSSKYLDYATELDFNSSIALTSSSTKCVNVSIPDNGIPGSIEVVALSLHSTSAFVNIERNTSMVTIENDAVVVNFEPYTAMVSESAGCMNICVAIETTSVRRRPISVQLHGRREGNGTSTIIQPVIFTSMEISKQCVCIYIMNDNIPRKDRLWSFYLSSNDSLVRVNSMPIIVTVMDDDKVYIDLVHQPYSMDCGGYYNVCMQVTGAFNNITINGTLITEVNEAILQHPFLLSKESQTIHCFELHLERERNGNLLPGQVKVYIQLYDYSRGIIMRSNETYVTVRMNCDSTRVLMMSVVISVTALCICIIGGSCVVIAAIVALQKKWTRTRYKNFQNKLIDSFDISEYKEDDTIYLITTTNTTDLDDDNLSLIVPFEPPCKCTMNTSSSDTSAMLDILTETKNLESYPERCDEDSGGYINNLNETDDRPFLLPQPNSADKSSTDNNSDILASPGDSSSLSSSQSSLEEAHKTASARSSNFREHSPMRNSTGSHIVSSKVSIRSDLDENDDSGYPRNTLLSIEGEFPYNQVSGT